MTLRRQPGNQLIKRVKPSRKGKFTVPLKWGHRPTLTVIARQGKRIVKARMKATGAHSHQGRSGHLR